MNMKMNSLDTLALWLVLAGGINWGLIGIFKYNLVYELFGASLTRWIYGVVGVAAAYIVLMMLYNATGSKKR